MYVLLLSLIYYKKIPIYLIGVVTVSPLRGKIYSCNIVAIKIKSRLLLIMGRSQRKLVIVVAETIFLFVIVISNTLY